MKIRIAILTLIIAVSMFGAMLRNIPISVTQPDGTKLDLFSSGDEYFNRLHDQNDYTIIQGDDGWYYYGINSGDEVIPSKHILGKINPALTGIPSGVKISEKLYRQKVETKRSVKNGQKDAPTTGTINNLVIFIRFSDEGSTIFNRQRSYYDAYFNKSEGPSLQHYYKEVSYNRLEVNTVYYPNVDDFSTNLSYQDTQPRGYFQPYNATTNPIGYQNDSQSTTREHELLERAVNAVAAEVPTSLDIDADNDGNVDNVIFLISGAPGEWASLLWPHMWYLYTKNVTINRKRVWNYNFDLTGTATYFTVGVIAHEFFHTLGAPDLYHYYNDTAPDAVGSWDVMNGTSNPPQYMGAWMKYKYGHWIDTLHVADSPGTYTLNPLQSETRNIFKIPSPASLNEFFILEYRKQTGLYEPGLPGTASGILIYRINSNYDGNADGPPDEVYLFRPNGTLTASGQLSSAVFSAETGRTDFNFSTNPYPFLSDGSDGDINITNITSAGETISFTIALNVLPPKNLVASTGYGSVELNWAEPDPVAGASVSKYHVYRDGVLLSDAVTETSFTDNTVTESSTYVYSVSAYYTGGTTGESMTISSGSVTYKAPFAAPYSTGFADATGWSQVSENCTPRWESSSTSIAGGTSPEMIAVLENFDPAVSRIVTPPISTSGIDTLRVSFKHFYDAYEAGVNYKVQISQNKYDWTDTPWSFSASDADAGPETVVLDLVTFPDPVYVAWTLDGNQWAYDGWYIDDVSVSAKNPTSVNDTAVPSEIKLYGNYPNPFNPETTISFSLPENTYTELNIYDIKGSLVRTLVSGQLKAGHHRINWNGRDNSDSQLSSGVYYISLNAKGERLISRSLMIK
jgi:M6 family metalloprotease-like protein